MPEHYPKHLIPNKTLKIIPQSDLNPSHHIGIWVDSETIFKDDDGLLNAAAVNVKRIPHFSSNKIPNSVPRDLNIIFNDDYNKVYQEAWIEGQDGVLPEEDHFIFEDDRNHYFLLISDINGYADSYEKLDKTYSFTVNLIHKPTITNYWHFEFVITSEGKEIDYSKVAWVNNICASIRGNLVQKAIFEI